MSLWILLPLYIIASLALTFAAMSLTRRKTKVEQLRKHHEVAGFIYAIVGVVYAVLLAFVVVVVWEQFQEAGASATREANAVASVYRLADVLPPGTRGKVRADLREYAQGIVTKDWPAMANGHFDPDVEWQMDRLWEAVTEFKPETPAEIAGYDHCLTSLTDLSANRRIRLLHSKEHVPGLMWGTLFFGGLVTVGFTFFFGVESARTQAAITGSLTVVLVLVLALISAIDHPFAGDLKVQPEAFQNVLEHMDLIDEHEQHPDSPRPASAFTRNTTGK